jgi:hypothetical protein
LSVLAGLPLSHISRACGLLVYSHLTFRASKCLCWLLHAGFDGGGSVKEAVADSLAMQLNTCEVCVTSICVREVLETHLLAIQRKVCAAIATQRYEGDHSYLADHPAEWLYSNLAIWHAISSCRLISRWEGWHRVQQSTRDRHETTVAEPCSAIAPSLTVCAVTRCSTCMCGCGCEWCGHAVLSAAFAAASGGTAARGPVMGRYGAVAEVGGCRRRGAAGL